MNLLQTILMVVCLAIYLFSIFIFLAVCVGSCVKKTFEKRTLKRQSQRFPCGNCRYFSNETLLKCAVHPVDVMTEVAQNCLDFETEN